jgi:hypothetical protein
MDITIAKNYLSSLSLRFRLIVALKDPCDFVSPNNSFSFTITVRFLDCKVEVSRMKVAIHCHLASSDSCFIVLNYYLVQYLPYLIEILVENVNTGARASEFYNS